ncbi:MAG TPA: hypothetical protein VKD69_15150 [Vicinamibacterales bacterium]|nr:hypothetical protein [Vicinamibacterales bacterium]
MRSMLTTVLFFASLVAASADDALPARAIGPCFSQLPASQPVSFDLVDVREDQRAALVPVKSDVETHSHFITKHHLGVAAGYDNGSVHGSVGYYLTVAEWGRWNFGVPSIALGLGRYPTYNAKSNKSIMEEQLGIFVSMASAHYRAGYIAPWGVHWYVNIEQVFDVHANRAGSQLGISFSRN